MTELSLSLSLSLSVLHDDFNGDATTARFSELIYLHLSRFATDVLSQITGCVSLSDDVE